MMDIKNSRHTDAVLAALGEQLAAAAERYELVVVGGSASWRWAKSSALLAM